MMKRNGPSLLATAQQNAYCGVKEADFRGLRTAGCRLYDFLAKSNIGTVVARDEGWREGLTVNKEPGRANTLR